MDQMEVPGVCGDISVGGINSIALAISKGIQSTEEMKNKFILAVIIVFVVLTAVFYYVSMQEPKFRFTVLMTGNAVMAGLTLVTYAIVISQLKNRPAMFVNGVRGASFLKLMVCMVALVAYVVLDKANIYKPVIFVLFGIYAIYTVIETWLLTRLARETK